MASLPTACRCTGGILHKTSALIHSRARGQAMCFQPWFAHELRTGLHGLLCAASGHRTSQHPSRLNAYPHGRGYSVVASSDASGGKYLWKDSSKRPRVCILGGGFAGLYTALRLESLVWAPEKKPQIVLVDQLDRFVFKPLLYELLTQEVAVWEIAPHFSSLLENTDITFLQASVDTLSLQPPSATSSVSGEAGAVTLSSGVEVEFDWLVLAMGAKERMSFVEGAEEHAVPFYTLEHALSVDSKLTALERSWSASLPPSSFDASFPSRRPIQVVVVGGGYSGVELAATVKERLGSKGTVTIVDPSASICSNAPAPNRNAAEQAVKDLGVSLLLRQRVTSISHTPSLDSSDPASPTSTSLLPTVPPFCIALTSTASPSDAPRDPTTSPYDFSDSTIDADLVLWTVGSSPVLPKMTPGPVAPEQGASAGREGEVETEGRIELSARGQAVVEESLRVPGLPVVFAVGDSAYIRDYRGGGILPATAQVAIQQADYCGWNIWASINSRPLLPFRFQNLGEMMVLGNANAAATLSFLDDFFIGGRVAHAARKLAYLYRLPTIQHKARVGASWLSKTMIETVSDATGLLYDLLGRR